MQVTVNDLVIVTETYMWKVYYLDPEKIVGGSHGIWLNKEVMTLAKGQLICK